MESGDKIASLSLSLLSSARGPPPPSPPSREGGGGRGSATGRAATAGFSGGTGDLLTAGVLLLVAAGDLAAAAGAAVLPGPTGVTGALLLPLAIPKHKVQIKIDCTLCTLYILVHLYYDVVLVYSSFVHLCDDVVHIRGYIARERRIGTKTCTWHHGRTLWVRVTACHGLVAVLRVQSNISERKERKNSRCFSRQGNERGQGPAGPGPGRPGPGC